MIMDRKVGNREVNNVIAEQLRTENVPGHRDFIRSRAERLAPPVIGSPIKPVIDALSKIGTVIRL